MSDHWSEAGGPGVGVRRWGQRSRTLVAFDGANIWVATALGAALKLRASDGTILTTLGVGGELRGVAFDGANIWVVATAKKGAQKL